MYALGSVRVSTCIADISLIRSLYFCSLILHLNDEDVLKAIELNS